MKIAFLVKTFPSLSETFILNQITGLIDQGYDVDIYASEAEPSEKIHPDVISYNLLNKTHYQPSFPKNYLQRVIKAVYLFFKYFPLAPVGLINCLNYAKYGKPAASLQLLYLAIPFIKEKAQKYDIIHCHFAGAGTRGAFIKESLNLKAKIITTFYGYDVNAHPLKYGKDVYLPLFERGDSYIAISNFIAQEAISLGCPKNKITRLPLGINPQEYTFSLKCLSENEPIKIVTIARLVEKKGLEYSIKAIAHLTKTYPHILYRIAGDGPLRKQLETLIEELGISRNVKLLGWQTKTEVNQLYEDSHIFILASVTASNGDKEGQGLVLQEAQSMGLPVVATLHNGFPDSIQDEVSGFLVPERDVEALTEKIMYLVRNPDQWASIGKAGRIFVEENFDNTKLTKALLRFYKENLNST